MAVASSIILLTALYTQSTCEDVFYQTAAKRMKPSRLAKEGSELKQLASAACKTTNPDIVWQIAAVESGFEFNIIRFNRQAAVIRGQKAKKYLKVLERSQAAVNADFGVMQFNWYWHRDSFNRDPYTIITPKAQVKNLVEKMVPMVYRRCKSQWVGCYHNPANGPAAKQYNKRINQARKLLKNYALKVINPKTNKMTKESLTKKQMYSLLRTARNLKQARLTYKKVDASVKKLQAKTSQDNQLTLKWVGNRVNESKNSISIQEEFDL